MILLCEGVSRTGKSTLAREFSKALDWPIVKFNVPSDNAFEYFMEGLVASKTIGELCSHHLKHTHMIIDRLHLSNYSYNGCLGGGVLQPDEFWRLDEFLHQMDTWLFLMVDDPHAIATRMEGERVDGAHLLTIAELGHIQNRMIKAFEMSQIEPKGTFQLSQFMCPFMPPHINDIELTDQFHSVCDKINQKLNG